MSGTNYAQGRAQVSCQRCYRRKKRCDKLLPECNGCRKANVPCSFPQNGLRQASFSIKYVRGLERRISELEGQLAVISASSASSGALITANAPQEGDRIKHQDPQLRKRTCPAAPKSHASSTQWAMSDGSPATGPGRSTSLADGLKMLSLEATAEKYVGPSSGVAFAKLTQAMLRRLAPDQEAFVFGDGEEGSGVGVGEAELLPSFEGTLDFLDLDMMLDSPQHLTSMPIDRVRPGSENPLDLAKLEEGHIRFLLDFYFAHSHTLYPIIQQGSFVETLWTAYKDPFKALILSPMWQFRIWMVLAIGSTTYCSVSLMDETESIQLFNKAMSYFDAAMGCGELAALEVLMLQVSYSFFNSAGPNTWFLVGVAARTAIGMGLHTREVYENLAPDAADYQKRLFFSLYMMDRVVSTALGRPFAIQDEDITVEPFADNDDENITPAGIIPRAKLGPSSMAVPLHILELRKIASTIGTEMYSLQRSRDPSTNTQEILHKRLIEWRRSMPFPLPEAKSKVPHLCTSWFDLNYYTHLIMLYRPSVVQATVNINTVEIDILAKSSGMAIREANNLYRQQRFAFNWLNLMTVFNAALSLIYSTTARLQPDAARFAHERTTAIEDLELVMGILEQFCRKFPSAVQILDMVRTVLERLSMQSQSGMRGC
ncbi:fungal-specific transcription factor domain-containing protein [Aspergillus spinulosporus]